VPQLGRDHLGHQGARPLRSPAELRDVGPVIVGLDDRRHRAALAERGQVAHCTDRAHGRESTRSGAQRRSLPDVPRPVLLIVADGAVQRTRGRSRPCQYAA